MVAFRSKIMQCVRSLRPDTLVLLALVAWWILNLLQASFMDLANDEAYYWYFSQHLDWGYYDHPPLVAVLVWLTAWLPGTFGVRLATTLLQPLYLLLFWCLLRPSTPRRRDALVYVLLCFSQPLLQLYGFLALPDAPLLMSTVLFLWAYKRLCYRQSFLNASLLGVSVALLGYSKYHGVLVVAAVFLSNPHLLRRWHLYYAGALGLLLMAPHFWWQYAHDWVSFRYHLLDRNADSYRINFTLEYLAILLTVFNPLWVWHYLSGLRRWRWRNASMFARALAMLALVFVLFFLVSTVRGHVQPQWLLPLVFPCIALLFNKFRNERYLLTAGWVFWGLFLEVRLLAVVNPLGFKGELWHQREQYEAIASVAEGRPVVFMHTYTAAPKYTFYTGGEAYCAPFYFNRHSQWQFDTSDRALTGREVMVCNFTNKQPHCLPLTMGGGYRQLYYSYLPDYHPMRELVATMQPLNLELSPADSVFPLTVSIYNPYPYDIYSTDSVPMNIMLYFYECRYRALGSSCLLTDTLRAHDTTVIQCLFPQPALADADYSAGFAIERRGLRASDTGPRQQVRVYRTPQRIIIKSR